MNATQANRLSSLELPPAYRTLGVSPGDLVDAIREEVDRMLKEAGGNRRKAFNAGLQRMHSSGLITNADLKRLEKVGLIVLEVAAGKRSHEEGAAALDRLYLDAVKDAEGSLMGSTMIGVTYSARRKQVAQALGLMGMVIGGMLTGSPWGALIGGIIGYTLGGGCKKD